MWRQEVYTFVVNSENTREYQDWIKALLHTTDKRCDKTSYVCVLETANQNVELNLYLECDRLKDIVRKQVFKLCYSLYQSLIYFLVKEYNSSAAEMGDRLAPQ